MLQHVQHVANTESSGKRGRAFNSWWVLFFFIRTVPIFSGIHCVSRGFKVSCLCFPAGLHLWPLLDPIGSSAQTRDRRRPAAAFCEFYDPINEERQWYHIIFHCPSDNPTYSQTSYIFNMYIIIYRYNQIHITLHYNTIRYITLRYVALHCINYIAFSYITLQHLTLHYDFLSLFCLT